MPPFINPVKFELLCEEKKPGYATITTEKGEIIFDCEGNYLPQKQ